MMLEVLIKAFLIALEVNSLTVPQRKDLRYGKYQAKGLSFNCQDALKSANLLHKQGFVDSQVKTTVLFSAKSSRQCHVHVYF